MYVMLCMFNSEVGCKRQQMLKIKKKKYVYALV